MDIWQHKFRKRRATDGCAVRKIAGRACTVASGNAKPPERIVQLPAWDIQLAAPAIELLQEELNRLREFFSALVILGTDS